MKQTIPEGFRPLKMVDNGFIEMCGPLYGRWLEEDKQFTMGLRVERRHCNPGNACHGGMLATMADMTLLLGTNLQLGLGRYLLTINLATDYIAQAPLGSWVEGRTQVLRAGRNLIFSQGMLTIDDTVVCRINGLFKPTGEADPSFSTSRYFA